LRRVDEVFKVKGDDVMDNQMTYKKTRILLVDDDPDQLLLLGALLEGEGYEVAPRNNGQEVFDRGDYKSADLLVADICMPGMSGLELAAELKRRGCSKPVILLTAGNQQIDFSSIRFRVDAFCMKQNLKESLLPKIHGLVDQACSGSDSSASGKQGA